MKLQPILYLLLSSTFLGLASAWAFSVLAFPVTRRIAAIEKRFPSGFWFALGTAPLMVGATLFGLSMSSGWLSQAGWIVDHCPLHEGHPHLCLAHIAQSPPTGFGFWFVGSVAGLWMLGHALHLRVSGARLFSRLREASRPSGEFRVIPGDIAAAFTAGLVFPEVFLTTGACRLLQPRERQVVLAHERRHARRRDPLRSLILTWSARCFPGLGPILWRWRLAAETECDRAAVQAGLSKTLVAGTILKLKRACPDHSRPTSLLHYVDGDANALKTRITVLLGEAPIETWTAKLWIIFPCVWLLCCLFFSEVHHSMETLLGWFSS